MTAADDSNESKLRRPFSFALALAGGATENVSFLAISPVPMRVRAFFIPASDLQCRQRLNLSAVLIWKTSAWVVSAMS